MLLAAFDLDDTLYAERDFLRSAWREIARMAASRYRGTDYADCLAAMWTAENAFDGLISHLLARGNSNVPTAAELVEMYRSHRPDTLPFKPGAEQMLADLRSHGARIALITDGRVRTQMAKVEALRLDRFIDPADIIISEAAGHDKTTAHNFERLQLAHHECSRMAYVGDNPAKDFVNPRRLGWTTIALLDHSGANIHPQNFDSAPADYLPDFRVDSLADVTSILYPQKI